MNHLATAERCFAEAVDDLSRTPLTRDSDRALNNLARGLMSLTLAMKQAENAESFQRQQLKSDLQELMRQIRSIGH